MGKKNCSRIAANIPLRLEVEELEKPEKVVNEFFKTFDLDEIRSVFENVFSIAMCVSEDELDGYRRWDMLFIQKETVRFVEAVFFLRKKGKKM